jgi:hypothetical protein
VKCGDTSLSQMTVRCRVGRLNGNTVCTDDVCVCPVRSPTVNCVDFKKGIINVSGTPEEPSMT